MVGLSLVFLGSILTFSVEEAAGRWAGTSPVITGIASLVVLSAIPTVFGFWVGFRQRNPRSASFGLLASLAVLLSLLCSAVFSSVLSGNEFIRPLLGEGFTLLLIFAVIVLFFGYPPWLAFVSGSAIGNAWQRRRMLRMVGIRSTAPVSRGATQGAGQQPRKGMTPAQQAILGWGGAIISALITLVGTIITGRGGP